MQAALLFVSLIAATGPRSQAPQIKVGDPAPALGETSWLKGEPVTEFKKGTSYVLEFWATWCGSCTAAFPHLNQLAKDDLGGKVVFVSVTDEETEHVKKFLSVHPLETRIAIDKSGTLFAKYGATILPRTVLVGPDGAIAGITAPANVSEDSIKSLAAGRPLNLPIAGNKRADLEWDKPILGTAPTVTAFLLQESDSSSGAMQFPVGTGRMVADGVCVGNLIELAYQATPEEVQNSWSGFLKGCYRLSVQAPDASDERARDMLKQYLAASFPFHAEWGDVDQTVPVIKLLDSDPGPNLKPSKEAKAGGSAGHGKIDMQRVPIATIVKLLGTFVYGKPGVDETGLTGLYDIHFEWTPDDKASIECALKACGLKCEMESRKVRRLVVTPLEDR